MLYLLCLLLRAISVPAFKNQARSVSSTRRFSSSYLDELNIFKTEKKKAGTAICDLPLWEISQGPHFDMLQGIFESFWIPDFTNADQFILDFDLIVLEKKKSYYNKLIKQPWGQINAFPPKERLEYERINTLSKQKWIRKYPPIATVGEDTYRRLKNYAQIDYFGNGVEDFALHIPDIVVPTKRVLVLRFRDNHEPLVQTLVLKGVSCVSAYSLSWSKKAWNTQEERMAKEVD
ncbi:hypothetical protein B484DRAFT_404163, partial [Ochromonadaceae sp. CCMP2298]